MSNVLFPMQPLSALTTAIKDGTHGTHRRVAEGVPLLSAKNITANGEITLDDSDDLISESEYLDLTRSFQLQPDDLLLTIVGSLGRRAIYSGQRITFQRSVAYIRPYQQKVLSRFLFHWMGHPAFTAELLRRSNATAQAGLYLGELAKVLVPAPELRQQGKVAQVLDTLDTTIHETEAIIGKLKAVKQGLLHDLLTRGIDAKGELRPPQADAPHLYKESPLGWIPKEWACRPFGELCESSAFGPRFPSDAYDENGPLATLRTTDMDDEGAISLSTMPRAAIKPSVFADHLLRPGDLVISRSGTCGVTGVFAGHDIPVVPGAFLIRFRLKDLRLNRFYRRYFNSSLGRPHLERLAVGGVQKNIKGSDVLCLQVPHPGHAEAVAIADRLESVEHDIEGNQQLLTKLQLQKSGLMDDLLTGRVRVTPLLAEAAQQAGSA